MTALRPYQQRAHDMLIDWMYQNEGNPCLVLPTGAGKSHIVAHTVKHALTTWPGTRITMLTHRKELIAQNFSKLLQHWPQAPVGIYSAALKQKNIDQITFGGVQSVRGKAGLFGHQDLVIIDECHLISHKKEGVYRNFIDALTEINPHLRVVGLTATPWRLGHGTITEGDALFDDLIEPVTITQLIDQGFLSPLRSKHTDFIINTSELKVRGGEYVSKELQESVNDYELNLKAVSEIIERAEDRRHWLIFCAGVEHAESIASILNSSGIKTAVVHGELNGKERDQILSDFKSGVYRAVTNCDVLTTGFDFPDIDLLVMLRPTLSPALYCLDEKTEILTPDGWSSIDDDIYQAAAFDLNTSSIHWSNCKKIVRKLYDNESFYGIKNPMIDISVTDNHNIVYSKRRYNRNKLSGWRMSKAKEMTGEFYIPVAGFQRAPGLPLTDSEIKFLGLVITDGTINSSNNAITIGQSDRHEFCVDYIENTLKACGFKYGWYKRNDDTNYGERRYPMNYFYISKGKPRGTHKNKRGWGDLDKYVSKNYLDIYEDMTREQLIIFIEALWIGDGKKNIGVKWESKTKSICSANLDFLNKLQSLCVRRGMRANISKSTETVWSIYININQQVKSIVSRSCDSRPVYGQRYDIKSDRVWCVEVDTGAIVTRRNGKVSFLGNCQIAGRGMRLKSHTDHCMVLDFAGNVKKHGPITNVTPPTSRRATEGDAPIKVCDQCHEICHAAARVCPACGAEFEVDKKRSLMLHNDDIMGIAGNFMAVGRWIWSVHTSRRNQAQMLKVKYYPKVLTANPITEYLTINHAGWAGTKARRTLANIMNETLPVGPADLEALTEQLNKAAPPVYIEYRESGKFPEILTRGFNGRNDVPNGLYLARMPISIIEKERKLYAAVKHVKSLGITDKQIDEICRREAGIGLIHVSNTSHQKMDNIYNSLLDIAPNMA